MKHGTSLNRVTYVARSKVFRLTVIYLLFLLAAGHGVAAPNPIVLRLASWEGDQALSVQRKTIAEFEQRYPYIKVKLENVDYGMYQQKMLAQYAANVAPDVLMMGFERFQQFAKRKALLPLDGFIAKTPGFDIKQYYEPIVRAHRRKGRLYVLPRDIAPIGLIYYNKRLFDEAGIPYPDGSWTWDDKVRPELRDKDFLWVMRQLTKKNQEGKTIQWGYSPGWPSLTADCFSLSLGGRFTDDYENPTKILFDSPAMRRGYGLAADLIFKYGFEPSPTEMSSVMQTNATMLFVSQKVAMYQTGIWEVPNLRKFLKPGTKEFFDYDITLFPAYKDGTRRFPTGGSGYSIASSTQHPWEAWLLVQWLAGPQGMKNLAESGLGQPAIRRIALSDVWIPGPNTPVEMRYPAHRIVTDEAIPYVHFAPSGDAWPEVYGLLTSRLDTIWLGTKSAQQALHEGTAEAQARLDALRKQERLPPFAWGPAILGGLLLASGILLWVYWPERGVRYSNREKRENRSAYWFIAPWLIGIVVFTFGPMALSFFMSMADWDIIQPARWRGAANYADALTADPRFWLSLRVTFVYTLVAVPLGLFGSLMLALLLNAKVRGMALFRAVYYLPSLASVVAASLIWRRIFQPEGGLLNTIIYGANGKGDFLGLASLLRPLSPAGQQINWLGNESTALTGLIIMSLWGIGGGMVILLAGLQNIPQEYYEAAVVDGAGALKRFRAVTIPLLSPALFFCLVTGVIGSFQVFTQSFVMTSGGPNDATLFYMLHLYRQAFDGLRMGYASALAWVLFVIILIFTLLQFRLSKWVYYEADSK